MAWSLQRALSRHIDQKAISDHPAFHDNIPVSVYSPGASRQDAVISQREASRHSEVYGGRQAIDWVYDCIGLYSDATATAPWRLEKKDGTRLVREKGKGTPPDYQVGPSDLYDLLDKPNPFMLYDELVELLIIDLLLVGNAYWFKWRTRDNGKPLAIYRLAPSHVKIVPGPFGPKGYEYQPPGAKDPLKIKLDDVIHYRRPNPHSAYYGLGVIQGGGRAFDLELAITDTIAAYYENRADPSLIVQSDRRVPRDVFTKLKMQLRERYQGSARAGELMVLEAGLKASPLSNSARDALFAELSQMSRDRVFSKFRTSPKLFGDLGTDSLSDVRHEFDNSTLRPFMDRLQRRVTEGLVNAWDCEFKIDYRHQLSPEQILQQAGTLASMPGIKVRDIRRQFAPLGIEESTGDPDIDEMVLNLPGQDAGPTGQGPGGGPTHADPNLPGEPGRPPIASNTRAFPKGGAKLAPGTAARRPNQKAFSMADLEAEVAAAEAKAFVRERADALRGEQKPKDPSESLREANVNSVVQQTTAGLRDAVHNLERGLLDHVEGKALKPGLAGRIRKSESWTTFRNEVEKVLDGGARSSASAAVMDHSSAGFRSEEDIDYESIAKSVVNRPDALPSIVNTLKRRVLSNIEQAVEESAGRQETLDAVSLALRDWKDNQAPAIAETETVHAYNEGTLTVAEKLGHDTVFVTDGHDTDEPCQEADGSTWTIDHARENRLEHPRCRRAFLLVG